MPIDMPLEKLKSYKGTNPRPDDFDAYWERGLAEMRAVKSECTLVPAKFQAPFAECYDMYFNGVGGGRVYAKVLKPKHIKGKIPALLMFHGYHFNCGEWNDKLQYVAAGFMVVAMDNRGQGGLSKDAGCPEGTGMYGEFIRGLDSGEENLLMRRVYLDTVQLANLVMDMPEVDETRVCAMGGSCGAALTLACAALQPRISRICIQYPFLSDYKRVWEMNLAKQAYDELRKYFRSYDPSHEKEDEIFEKLGYIDAHHMASKVKAEVLMAITLMDDICPPSTQFAVYNQLQTKKEVVLYYDHGHEILLPGCQDRFYQYLCEIV